MNKTINISLNGQHFNIDENAYTALKKYLKTLEVSFSQDEGKDEIMQDIETRIAELFQGYLGLGRDVVSEYDVEKMITVMGRPEQYLEEGEESKEQAESQQQTLGNQTIEKKLYRDLDEKIIAGVLAGISHYFGWNPMYLRGIYLGLPLMTLIFDAGFSISFFVISYIVMWIIMPIAHTNIQKMQMYGTPVTVDTIQKNFSKEEIKETVDNISGFTREVVTDATPFLERVLGAFLSILKVFFGILLMFMGIGALVGAFTLLITSLFSQNFLYSFGDLLFDQAWQYYVFVFAVFFLILSIGVLITYFAIRLLSNQRTFKNSSSIIISCISAFFISLVVIIIMSTLTAMEFREEVSFYDKEKLMTDSDTLRVSFAEPQHGKYVVTRSKFGNVLGWNQDMDSLKIRVWNDIEIKKSYDNHFYVEKVLSAKGRDEKDARKNISKISYPYQLRGNHLYLPEEMMLPSTSKYRFQEVQLVLYVPEGKHIETDNIDDIQSNGLKGFDEAWDNQDNDLLISINGDTIYCNNCEKGEESFKPKNNEIKIDSEDGKVIINQDSLSVESEDGNVKIKFKE